MTKIFDYIDQNASIIGLIIILIVVISSGLRFYLEYKKLQKFDEMSKQTDQINAAKEYMKSDEVKLIIIDELINQADILNDENTINKALELRKNITDGKQ